MDTQSSRDPRQQQRIGLCFASFTFLGVSAICVVRTYFAVVDEPLSDRMFVTDPNLTGLLPFLILSWIFGFITVGNSITASRRVTWDGLVALMMLSVPAIPVSVVVVTTWWQFLSAV
jgi:hypothetical protein